MTDQELNDLSPSALNESVTTDKLNELVARKLNWEEGRGKFSGLWRPPESNMAWYPLPNFCHSIEAAWEVVDHIRKSHLMEIIARTDGSFACVIQTGENPASGVGASDDTAPMVICLAFLRVP